MSVNTAKSVGIYLVVMLETGPHVLLHERGVHNAKKTLQTGVLVWESWPYLLQPTIHGRLKIGEEKLAGLSREMREELGFNQCVADLISQKATLLVSSGNHGRERVAHYAASISASQLDWRHEHLFNGLSFWPLGIIETIIPVEHYYGRTENWRIKKKFAPLPVQRLMFEDALVALLMLPTEIRNIKPIDLSTTAQ